MINIKDLAANIGEAFGIAEAIQDCVDKGEDTSQVIKRIVDGAA